MKSVKIIPCIILACAAISCSSPLDEICGPDFKRTCIDSTHISVCENDKLTVVECSPGLTCYQNACTIPQQNTGNPGTSTDNPGTSTDNPGTSTDNPGTSTDNPGTSTDNPGTSTDNPGTTTDPVVITHDVSVDDIGEECDPDVYHDGCDQNNYLYCDGYVVEAMSCQTLSAYYGKDYKCHTFANGISDCVVENACDTASETITCNNKNAVISGCMLAEDGHKYQYEGKIICDRGCEPGKGCIKLTEDEGNVCNPDLFTERCENNVAVSCLGGFVKTYACSEKAGSSCHYIESDNRAECFTDADICTTGKYACSTIVNGQDSLVYADEYRCRTAENGQKYMYYSNRYHCENVCSETEGCVPLLRDEGTGCDDDYYEERCEKNGAVYCENGIVAVKYCESGKTCLSDVMSRLNVTGCYDTDKDKCSNPGEIKYQCNNRQAASHIYFSEQYTCKKLSDGQYYYTLTDTIFCDSECKGANGQCK